MNKNHKIAVIVDGYRNSAVYAPLLRKHAYQCIHIKSSPGLSREIFSDALHKENYLENIIYHGDIEEIIKRLKKYPAISFVIAGLESGIMLADTINKKLQLPFANIEHLGAARYNKFFMIEAVKQAGLKTAEQIVANNATDILNWSKQIQDWPIVLKPLKSAGTDHVIFCHNEKEIKDNFQKIYGKKDIFEIKIEQILAQSFLRGIEYIVNTTSFAGKHYLTDLWVYKKVPCPGHSTIYDYKKILSSSAPEAELLKSYTFRALDAIGMQYGVAHSEIMLTDEGPALVEINTRPMGVIPPDLITTAVGYNQMELFIDSLVDHKKFQQQIAKPYQLKKYLMAKFLISRKEGIIKKISYLDEIRKLPSFHSMKLSVKVGETLRKTIDIFTPPGLVFLLHEDEQVLQNDYEQILAWEKDMFVI